MIIWENVKLILSSFFSSSIVLLFISFIDIWIKNWFNDLEKEYNKDGYSDNFSLMIINNWENDNKLS